VLAGFTRTKLKLSPALPHMGPPSLILVKPVVVACGLLFYPYNIIFKWLGHVQRLHKVYKSPHTLHFTSLIGTEME